MLSVEAQDIFPLLFFFPSGLSRDLARGIWERNGNRAVLELFRFSMAEKSPTASDWRVTLPEPARSYAESKLQQGRGIDKLVVLSLLVTISIKTSLSSSESNSVRPTIAARKAKAANAIALSTVSIFNASISALVIKLTMYHYR